VSVPGVPLPTSTTIAPTGGGGGGVCVGGICVGAPAAPSSGAYSTNLAQLMMGGLA